MALGGAASGAFADKSVGIAKAVTVAGNTISGLDAGNYTLLQQSGLSAGITKANLAVSGLSTSNRVYDATTVAALNGTAAITKLGTDEVVLGGSASGNYADKNAGIAKAVTVAGKTISGADAGNYTLVQQSGLSADITKVNLVVSGLSTSNRVYDATATAVLGGNAVLNAFAGDNVILGGTASGAFASKDVGTGKAVTVSGKTISGTDAGNYTLVQETGLSADITKANLSVSGLTASNKIYDATTAATLSGAPAVSAFAGDIVTLSGSVSGSFVSKNAGLAKPVTVVGNILTGADAVNYTLVQQSGLTANISPAPLKLVAGTATKTYDGSSTASVAFTHTRVPTCGRTERPAVCIRTGGHGGQSEGQRGGQTGGEAGGEAGHADGDGSQRHGAKARRAGGAGRSAQGAHADVPGEMNMQAHPAPHPAHRPASPPRACSLAFVFVRAFVLMLAFGAAPALADGRLTHLSGAVSVLKPDGRILFGLAGMTVAPGDVVITGAGGYARVEMTVGGEMVLRPESQLRVESYRFTEARPAEDNFVFSILKGGLRTVTGLIGKRGNRNAYELKTSTATIGIRGTQFDLRVCQANCGALADGTYVAVRLGAIQTTNAQGSLGMAAGQVAYVPPLRAPVILPRDPGIGFTPPAVRLVAAAAPAAEKQETKQEAKQETKQDEKQEVKPKPEAQGTSQTQTQSQSQPQSQTQAPSAAQSPASSGPDCWVE